MSKTSETPTTETLSATSGATTGQIQELTSDELDAASGGNLAVNAALFAGHAAVNPVGAIAGPIAVEGVKAAVKVLME